ncbi:uncharacterized protein [Clytia hemisphaerica]|uniref:Cnidarian restricted protein n=1 Tax=Clytia hemisphaerica TaxID=252671 RepID=A0A7M5WQ70_9CNID|eukprot:TCONS_00005655-protein
MRVIFALCLLVVCAVQISDQHRRRPGKPIFNRRRCRPICRRWTYQLRRKYQQCLSESGNLQSEVDSLKNALNSTGFVLEIAPQDIEPPTADELELVRTGLIDTLQNITFNSTGNATLPGKRKRRSVDQCPQDRRQILATIDMSTGIPPGKVNTEFLGYTDSLGLIDSNLIHSCAECRYRIRIEGYIPEVHQHVICLKDTKPLCMGGIGQCAKLEVLTQVYNPQARDINNIVFNKGCSCQQSEVWSFLGDGNN